METLRLSASRNRALLLLAVAGWFLFEAMTDTDSERIGRIVEGLLGRAVLYAAAVAWAQSSTVLVELGPWGIRDERLEPPLLSKSAIESARFEPVYWGGGALLIELTRDAPEFQVRNAWFTFRGRDSRISGKQLRLSLDGLAFDGNQIRAALRDLTRADERSKR